MCIFHLPDKNPSEAEEFNSSLLAEIKKMQEDVTIEMINLSGFRFPRPAYKFPTGTRFEKEINFSRAVFEGEADFSEYKFLHPATFDQAKFLGKLSFYRAKFSDVASFDQAEFFGDAAFQRSEFSGATSFDYAKFSAGAYFFATKFSGSASFSMVKFSIETFFDRAEFSHEAYFFGSEFSDYASVSDARFFGFTMFDNAKFLGAAEFDRTEFVGDATFVNCEFSGNTCFLRSKVASIVTFRSTIFQTTDDQILSSSIKQYTRFREIKVDPPGEVRFEGGVCMSRVSLHYADLRRISFLDVKWGRLGDRASIMEHGILEERKRRSKDEEMILPDLTPEHVQQIYVRLRRNLERGAGRYPEAGDFFINEKEMRKLILQQGRRLPLAENLPEWIILKLYGALALYGESIMLPVFWSVVAILGFTALKIVSFRLQTTDAKPYLDFLMESVMAFFQMRSEPGLDILERLISVPILGSLFIVLKRKFERR